MSEIKWIKLCTSLPSSKKLTQIRTLPNGDTIALLWVYLLCVAGEVNDNGFVYFTPEIPYTEEMLSNQFNMPVETVRLGLNVFERYGMIQVINNIMAVSNWEKYQSVDELQKIKEQTRTRVAKHREKQKQLACNVTVTLPVTQCNAIEEDIEKEIEIEKESIKKKNKKEKPVIKKSYGDFDNVLLSDEELAKLKERYPDKGSRLGYDTKIEELSYYLYQHPKKHYESHYATILNWIRKESKDNESKGDRPF